jgi:hypothetical protein
MFVSYELETPLFDMNVCPNAGHVDLADIHNSNAFHD